MKTTTIRVDRETHARLLELSEATGDTLTKTVRDAAEALQRLRFGLRVQEELAALKSDPAAWDDYLAQAETTSVSDGIS
ncbi:MAG: hypothetical protein OXB92_06915 [Acidimicrobiaceae bacterium]|nr:hypothetical protein [Acidimicrobiia bacterium]MCY4493566.1 hypothetical protein [Acidimicrobiaceae bacterium]